MEAGFDAGVIERQLARIDPARHLGDLLFKAGCPIDENEAIAVFQRLRDEKRLPYEVAFYLLTQLLIIVADDLTVRGEVPELDDLSDQIARIERAHGRTLDTTWSPGEGPPDWEALQDRYVEVSERFHAEFMRRHGERRAAKLFTRDPARFEAIRERGRYALFGPEIDMAGYDD